MQKIVLNGCWRFHCAVTNIITVRLKIWDFPGGPVVMSLHFHCSGPKFLSLAGKPSSPMLCGVAKNKINT